MPRLLVLNFGALGCTIAYQQARRGFQFSYEAASTKLSTTEIEQNWTRLMRRLSPTELVSYMNKMNSGFSRFSPRSENPLTVY